MNFIRKITSSNKKSLKDIVNVINDDIIRFPSHLTYIRTLQPLRTLDLLKNLQITYDTSNFLIKELNL